MFAEPITFTDVHGTEDFTLIKVNQDKYSSEYRYLTSLKQVTLKIRNTDRRDKVNNKTFARHNVELTEVIFPVAPSTVSIERKAYLTFEVQIGDDLTAVKENVVGLCNWLLASSGAAIVKMTNGES